MRLYALTAPRFAIFASSQRQISEATSNNDGKREKSFKHITFIQLLMTQSFLSTSVGGP